MPAYQTLADGPRQSLMLCVPPGATQTAEKFRPRKIAGNPLDFRLDKPYICYLFGRISVFEICIFSGKLIDTEAINRPYEKTKN